MRCRARPTRTTSRRGPAPYSDRVAEGRGATAIEGLKCADLVDAIGRLHRHRCHILDLVSPTPGRVLFGPAVTISYFPSCAAGFDPERYNLANLFYEAVGDEPEGKVVLLDDGPHRAYIYLCSPATTSPPTAPARRRAGAAAR